MLKGQERLSILPVLYRALTSWSVENIWHLALVTKRFEKKKGSIVYLPGLKRLPDSLKSKGTADVELADWFPAPRSTSSSLVSAALSCSPCEGASCDGLVSTSVHDSRGGNVPQRRRVYQMHLSCC